MRLSRFSFAVFITALVAIWSTGLPGTPPLVNYQGVLLDIGGSPIPNASKSVTFTIWKHITSTSSSDIAWSEVQTITTDGQGQFSVYLGEVNPILDNVFDGTDRWLGIKVDTDPEISPRTRLATTPFSFRISTIDGSTGGAVTGDVYVDNGKIGIGEPAPQSELTVGANIPYASMPGSKGITVASPGANTYLNLGEDDANMVSLIWTPVIPMMCPAFASISTTNQAPLLLQPYGAGGDVGIGSEWFTEARLTVVDFTDTRFATVIRNLHNEGKGLCIIGGQSDAQSEYALLDVRRRFGEPQSLFRVNGKSGRTYAREIEVSMSSWPDYVFDENYELSSPVDIEKYIGENGHLPDMPTEEEVITGGINLGDMDYRLLQKIEELTLHIINLDKKNSELERRLAELERKQR